MYHQFGMNGPDVTTEDDFRTVAPILAAALRTQVEAQGYRLVAAAPRVDPSLVCWQVAIDGVRVVAQYEPLPTSRITTRADTVADNDV